MIVSPDILRKDLLKLMKQIDAQIKEIEDFAESRGIQPEEVKDTNGNWVMGPILLAKVQALAAIVQLNYADKKK